VHGGEDEAEGVTPQRPEPEKRPAPGGGPLILFAAMASVTNSRMKRAREDNGDEDLLGGETAAVAPAPVPAEEEGVARKKYRCSIAYAPPAKPPVPEPHNIVLSFAARGDGGALTLHTTVCNLQTTRYHFELFNALGAMTPTNRHTFARVITTRGSEMPVQLVADHLVRIPPTEWGVWTIASSTPNYAQLPNPPSDMPIPPPPSPAPAPAPVPVPRRAQYPPLPPTAPTIRYPFPPALT
jgi:hypothetical protein